jgi:hypothetical protein
LERSVLEAAEAAAFPVRFEFPTCERAEAAALRAGFEAFFDLSVREAADAALRPVRLPLAIATPSLVLAVSIRAYVR